MSIVRILKNFKNFRVFQDVRIADFSPLFGWLATFTKGNPLVNVAAQLKCSKIVVFKNCWKTRQILKILKMRTILIFC